MAVSRHPALAINCRECGASPGERCFSLGGRVKGWGEAHWYRKADFGKGARPGPQPTQLEQRMEILRPLLEARPVLTRESPEIAPVIRLLDSLPGISIPPDWSSADPQRIRAELLSGPGDGLTTREWDLVQAIDSLLGLLGIESEAS